MRVCIDLDGTLCTQPHQTEFGGAEPYPHRIAQVNALYDEGHHVIIDTARGSRTGLDWRKLTEDQLERWGVKYHELRVAVKPGVDLYVDDRAVHPDAFFGGGPTLIERRSKCADPVEFFGAYADHLHAAMRRVPVDAVRAVIAELEVARSEGATVFVAANGGSATSAAHMANGIGAHLINHGGDGFRLLSLTDNPAAVTGNANDLGFDQVFVAQLRQHWRQGDRLLAVSCSGNSPNVLEAARWVGERGGRVIGLLGFDGGKLAALCDAAVLVSTAPGEYGPVEDAHMAFAHSLVHWYQQ